MKDIVIIGSGNVATHLALEFFNKGFLIKQVYSRSLTSAEDLAKVVSAEAVSKISDLIHHADLYIIALSDNAIVDIVEQINFEPKLIAHTAGSIHLNVLSKFKNYGVFYPLQTFTKGSTLDFKTIPFCIEANNDKSLSNLVKIAKECSETVQIMSSEHRKQCHLAAVIANNFTNHLYGIAEVVLSEKNISFDILKPLIIETANKVQKLSPKQAQTGPAVRNNLQVIEEHKKQLSSPELEKLYSFVSQSIIDLHKNNK